MIVDKRSLDYVTFAPLYSAARCPPQLKFRLYFFEELLVTTLFMFCDGIRPRHGNCGYVAVTIAAVTVFHFIFLIAMRPYESKVELVCALMPATILVVIGFLAALATLGASSPAVKRWLGYLLLAESVVVFFQSVVLAVYAYTMGQKRKLLKHQARVNGALSVACSASELISDSSNDVPLLAVPQGNESATATSNPLLRAQISGAVER